MVLFGALAPLICSCSTKNSLEKEVDAVNDQCNFRLNTKLEDFSPFWMTKYHYTVDPFTFSEPEYFEFKETRSDGVDVYTCGTENYFTTEFYFKNGLEVGFRTRDPNFGFSIFGKTIGYPSHGSAGRYEDSVTYLLDKRGYNQCSGHRKADVMGDGNLIYAWHEYNFENKLHIRYSSGPMYSFNGSVFELEVLLEA